MSENKFDTTSINYLERSLKKLEKNKPINLELINNINRKYMSAPIVLPSVGIIYDQSKIAHLRSIILEIVDKIRQRRSNRFLSPHTPPTNPSYQKPPTNPSYQKPPTNPPPINFPPQKPPIQQTPPQPPIAPPTNPPPTNPPPTNPPPTLDEFILTLRHSIRLDHTMKFEDIPSNLWLDKNTKPYDSPLLIPDGFRLATQIGIQIKNEGLEINKIVCSRLRRCIQTACSIANVFNIKEILIDNRLSEIKYIIMEENKKNNLSIPLEIKLLSDTEIQDMCNKFKINVIFSPTNSIKTSMNESWNDSSKRINSVTEEYRQKPNCKTCLVTHGFAVDTVANELKIKINKGPNGEWGVDYCAWIAAYKNIDKIKYSPTQFKYGITLPPPTNPPPTNPPPRNPPPRNPPPTNPPPTNPPPTQAKSLTNIDDVILHQQKRFAELRELLSSNSEVIVIIPGKNKVHELGTNIAKQSWDSTNYLKMKSNLDTLVEKLYKDYGMTRVKFGGVGFADKSNSFANQNKDKNPSCFYIHVWGANENNWNNNPNETISGSGQAAAMKRQVPGVFGIVTMPITNPVLILSPSKTNHECVNSSVKPPNAHCAVLVKNWLENSIDPRQNPINLVTVNKPTYAEYMAFIEASGLEQNEVDDCLKYFKVAIPLDGKPVYISDSPSDIIKLGGRDYKINVTYRLASGQMFGNPNNYPWMENILGPEDIDLIGFSEKHKGIYFEVNLIERNSFDSRLANIWSLRIHKITPEFIIPESQLNLVFSMEHNIISKYEIDRNGIVNALNYKDCFRGIKVITINNFSDSSHIKLVKIDTP